MSKENEENIGGQINLVEFRNFYEISNIPIFRSFLEIASNCLYKSPTFFSNFKYNNEVLFCW